MKRDGVDGEEEAVCEAHSLLRQREQSSIEINAGCGDRGNGDMHVLLQNLQQQLFASHRESISLAFGRGGVQRRSLRVC